MVDVGYQLQSFEIANFHQLSVVGEKCQLIEF